MFVLNFLQIPSKGNNIHLATKLLRILAFLPFSLSLKLSVLSSVSRFCSSLSNTETARLRHLETK